MTTRWSVGLRRLGLVALLALATGCENRTATAPDTPVAPQSGLLESLLGSSTMSPFTLITEPTLPPIDLRVSQLIGVNGGTLTLLGHTLTVPAGAVSVPTLFTMVALPTPEIDVELSATVTDLLGRVLNLDTGFNKPVTLSLSYARANNVTDPARLFIVYFNGTQLEQLPSTVDTRNKLVSTRLEHFSKYGMASN